MTNRVYIAIATAVLAAPLTAWAQSAPVPGIPPAVTTTKSAKDDTIAPHKNPSSQQTFRGFSTETAARSACKGDSVVLAEPASKTFYALGDAPYRQAGNGIFMCGKQASSQGYRTRR